MYPQLHEMYKHNIVTEFKDIWAFRHFFSLFSNNSQLPRGRIRFVISGGTKLEQIKVSCAAILCRH